MSRLKTKCRDFVDRRKTVVTKENRREHVGANPAEKEVARYRIDGCIQTESLRCDYLLPAPKTRGLYL